MPNKLRDLSGGTYATWEWVFIPEGSSVPVPCNQPIRNPNLMLPSAVTEWNNFESCMDGTYYLLTTSVIDGMTCTFKSAELVIKCETPDPCIPPAWNPRDLTCFAAATGTEYYFNFDSPVLQGPGVSAPCGGTNVTVSIGTLVGQILLTTEDSDYNLEGRVIVPAGTNLDLVCLTIPYCDALSQVCGTTQVCLGDAPNSGDVCPQGCGASVQYGGVSYSCSEQGSMAPYMVNIQLTDFRVNLPAGCTPQSVFIYNATGRMTDFELGFSGPFALQGSVIGSQFVVPTLRFGYLTYTNQRQACFNIALNGCKADGTEVNCATSLCIDIPPGCYPPNNTGQNPEIGCLASSNGLQYYEVYLPLGAQLTLPPGSQVVGMSSGGTSSTQTIGPGFVRMIIGVPIGTSDVWLVIGNPTTVRDSIELFGAPGQDYSQVWMPIPVQGDVVRHLRLPACGPDTSPRVASPFKSTTNSGLFETTLLELEIHPNPSSGRVAATLTGEGAIDWPNVRLVNTEGQVQMTLVSPTSDKSATLDLGHLPPGMYWLVGYATDGMPVQARVVKQ